MPTTPNTLYKRPMSEKYELPHTAREIRHNPMSQSSLLWILKLLSTCCDIKNYLQIVAGQEGIEPPTCGFGDRRSTN